MNICCRAAQLLKDRNLDSNSHAILFLNENDSPVSIKPLKSQSRTLKPAADRKRERAVVMFRYETASQTVFSTTQYYFCLTIILPQKYLNKSLQFGYKHFCLW